MLKSAGEILVVIFAVILVASTLASRSLNNYGYALPFGWTVSAQQGDPALIGAPTCNQIARVSSGFPFAETRPDESSCQDSSNTVAFILNNATYAASYLLIAGAIIMGIKTLRERRHG